MCSWHDESIINVIVVVAAAVLTLHSPHCRRRRHRLKQSIITTTYKYAYLPIVRSNDRGALDLIHVHLMAVTCKSNARVKLRTLLQYNAILYYNIKGIAKARVIHQQTILEPADLLTIGDRRWWRRLRPLLRRTN